MFTLISLLGSGLISILPGILSVFTRWMDNKKDIQLAQINADLQKTSMETGKAIAVLTAETSEQAAILAADMTIHDTFWDRVRSSIRPTITYLFVFLFVAAKITILYHMVSVRGMDVAIAVTAAWDEPTMAILAAVIAFWFGARMLDRTDVMRVSKK
jgi:hypothetical protein